MAGRRKSWWQGQRLFAIGALWLFVLVIGYVGFAKHFAALGEMPTPMALPYLTVQLFTMNSGPVAGPIAWELLVARWMAPAVAAYTALAALALLFYEQIQLVRVRFL